MRVEVNELKKVSVDYRNDVNIFEVVKEAKKLYEALKLFGTPNVTIAYKKDLMVVEEKATDAANELIRAIAALIMLNIMHMKDSTTSMARLAKHFGLTSFEATIGYRFKEKAVKVFDKSIKEQLEEYIGGKKLEEHNFETPATNLYNLVIKKETQIEMLPLWAEMEQLYECIITVGVENTSIWFSEKQIPKVVLKGRDIPERIRAWTMFGAIFMYRLGKNNYRSGCYHIDDDPHIRLLRAKFGLNNPVEMILGDTNVFEDKDKIKCVSLAVFVKRYLNNADCKYIMPKSPMRMQVAYDSVQRKIKDTSEEQVNKLWEALDALYKISKLIGAEDANVFYTDESGKYISTVAIQLPERIRAFCGEMVIYMYRMRDSAEDRSRLEEHLGLETPSKIILGDTNMVSCGKSMPCLSFEELLERYLES